MGVYVFSLILFGNREMVGHICVFHQKCFSSITFFFSSGCVHYKPGTIPFGISLQTSQAPFSTPPYVQCHSIHPNISKAQYHTHTPCL